MIASQNFHCPHLTYRAAFRRQHRNRANTDETIDDVCMTDREFCEEERRSAASGEPDFGAAKRCLDSKCSQKSISCDQCDLMGMLENSVVNQTTNHSHYWRCVDHRCRAVLCGRQGKNHSQQHYSDFRSHMLQENVASKRIWCNDCDHEVFPDHRNRRRYPAVWVPPEGSNEDSPKGLYNIGNTCFMNSALQCMTAVTPLNSYILGHSCNLKGKNVGSSYLWLLNEMWTETHQAYQKGVMPSRLLHAVRAAHPIFRGFQQHDTQEFLRLFMDSLAEETRVPHFYLETIEEKHHPSGSDEGSTTSDSETESFETCDSGNASEETMSTDVQASDCIDNHSDTKKEVKIVMKSIVSEIFDGQVESSVQCLSCKQTSSRFEVFQDLSLPIPTREELAALKTAERFDEEGNAIGWFGWIWDWMRSFFWGPSPTLEDCFGAFFSSDELKGKNMYSCEKCRKLRNGVKRCSLYRLPEVLCVHLKRFRMYEYSGGMGFSGKVSQYVQFPLENLDLKPFLHKDCPNQLSNYQLIGAICHIGSFLGGHYTAYIRRGSQWYLCDDSRVVPVSPETVADSEAYVLFYQKWDEEDESIKHQLLSEWSTADNENKADMKFHLISRKWLTQFLWGEEAFPLDNSDVVCPHGYIVPYETVHLGATWVPEPVWNLIISRYGGGPDLLHREECVICAASWKKYQKVNLKPKGTPESSNSNSDYILMEGRGRPLYIPRESSET